jgi:hypothetical protein
MQTWPIRNTESVLYGDSPLVYRPGWTDAPYDSRMLVTPFGGDPVTWERDAADMSGWVGGSEVGSNEWSLSPYQSPPPWAWGPIGGPAPSSLAVTIQGPNQYSTIEDNRIDISVGDTFRSEWSDPANQPGGGGGSNLVGDGEWIEVSGGTVSHIGPSVFCTSSYSAVTLFNDCMVSCCGNYASQLPIVREISLDEVGHVRWVLADGASVAGETTAMFHEYQLKYGPLASCVNYCLTGTATGDITCWADYIPDNPPT